MSDFSFDDLIIQTHPLSKEGTLRVDWSGKSSAREPSKVLAPFFKDVANQAAEGATSLEMHFEGIDHFNSSTITALIQLIQDLRRQQTRLVLVYDPTQKWQKLSFDALRVFQKDDGLLSIEESV